MCLFKITKCLSRKNLPFSKKADVYFRVQKLINKNSMGEVFKVMLATRDDCNFNSGFIK